ncbi:hypothetical protein VTK56DRAFT_2117 [Thermocarpiscus australiensis]
MKFKDGRDMDRAPQGSVRRARERAAAGLGMADEEPQMARPSASRQPATSSSAGQSQATRPQAPFPLQTKDGQIGVAISKPTQVPQWPLQEPIMAVAQIDGQPFRPPPGRSQPPQRPPRPSRVPSILDASKVQDHTPVFQYKPQSGRESTGQDSLTVPETPSSVSRPSTLSSVGSIPDFALPIQVPTGPSRRNVNLGPPPSARRGDTSFYSNASYVSPIPEESPRSRSHASFASSAAMPENWGAQSSPGPSPDYPESPPFVDTIAEGGGPSAYADDDAEESQLVRSASIGKRAKPTLVNATAHRAADGADRDRRPGPLPIQGPFKDGTGYVENSNPSSTTVPTVAAQAIGTAMTADTMLSAYSAASADDPSSQARKTTPSPNPPAGSRPYSRLSAIRRPPRLDIDAVRKAESRGSLTSLPDLIRRATRLAASLEKGRRPASLADDLDGVSGPDDHGADIEKHRSGLSDMLAAFPPPAQPAAAQHRRSIRDSFRGHVQSWPLPNINFIRTAHTSEEAVPSSDSQRSDPKRGRRCCGLPLWAAFVILIALFLIITAAVVVPVELLLVHRQNSDRAAQETLQECRQRLTCANGGMNVVNQGVCSCICTNGFTGTDCAVADGTACATIALTGANNVDNVTVGNAIPRLIQQAQANFSIPLSAGEIIAKLNAGNLSCSAENALVTFDGRATRQGEALNQGTTEGAAVMIDVGVVTTTTTVVVVPFTASSLSVTTPSSSSILIVAGSGNSKSAAALPPNQPATTSPLNQQGTATVALTVTSTVTTTMSMSPGAPLPSSSSPPPPPSSTFAVTEDVLDFARVAVLFILQEDSLGDAETAQVSLQKFFDDAEQQPGLASGAGGSSSSSSSGGAAVSVDAARNVTVGEGRSVDLVGFAVDVGDGSGRVGGRASVAARGIDAGGGAGLPGLKGGKLPDFA